MAALVGSRCEPESLDELAELRDPKTHRGLRKEPFHAIR
jgi:hypothetical protein